MSSVPTQANACDREVVSGSSRAPDGRGVFRGQDWRTLLSKPCALLVMLWFELMARATGKPWPGQRPLLDLGGMGWWGASTVALFATWLAVGWLSFELPAAGLQGLALSPVLAAAMVILVGRLRAQQVVFGHHAVHMALSKRWPWLNRLVKRFATVVTLAQNQEDYRSDHVLKHHKWRFFTTAGDPDAAFLLLLGFRAGMTRSEAYRLLWSTIASPRFHWLFAKARFRSAFVSADWTQRLLVTAWSGVLLGLGWLLPWHVTLLAIVLPLGPLYHVSALFQFLTEHRWLVSEAGPGNKRDYADRCVGRFALVPPPSIDGFGLRAIVAWASWALAMVPQLAVRLGVWVGDLPAHDHHHLVGPVGHDPHDWDEAIFERQRSIDEGDPSGLAAREAYGIKSALDWVFDGLASAK